MKCLPTRRPGVLPRIPSARASVSFRCNTFWISAACACASAFSRLRSIPAWASPARPPGSGKPGAWRSSGCHARAGIFPANLPARAQRAAYADSSLKIGQILVDHRHFRVRFGKPLERWCEFLAKRTVVIKIFHQLDVGVMGAGRRCAWMAQDRGLSTLRNRSSVLGQRRNQPLKQQPRADPGWRRKTRSEKRDACLQNTVSTAAFPCYIS